MDDMTKKNHSQACKFVPFSFVKCSHVREDRVPVIEKLTP